MAGRTESMPRRTTIRPFRSQTRIDEEGAKKIIDDLRAAFREIHQQNASSLSFEELYRSGYNLVLHKHGDSLYAGLQNEITDHLRKIGDEVGSESDQTLLRELVAKWDTHVTTMRMIGDILMYVDRTYVDQNKKEPVFNLGLRIFLEEVARHPHVRDRVHAELLHSIDADRHGELIDRDVVRNVLQMLVKLGINSTSVYEVEFEQDFLVESKNFYQSEAMQFIEVNSCPDYLVKADARLEEAEKRAQAYLHSTTKEKLLRLIKTEMIVAHAEHLVSMPTSGCRVMFRDDKIEDLARMYRLFATRNCREYIKSCMFDFVKEIGEKLVCDEETDMKPVDFVRELLDLQNKYARIVRDAFSDDKGFQKAVKEAFQHFVNMNQRCSRFLSTYLDELMRNKVRTQTHDDAELNQKVESVVILFRYIHDKDVFENFYKHQLAKRLLSGRSVSEDAESSIIKKLKTECGYLFTSKLEGMFKDMRLSKEIMDKYLTAFPRSQEKEGVPEISVTVLTAGFWPSEAPPPCNLPQEVVPVSDHFRDFYLSCHNGRRLTWQTNLGSADVKARFTESVTHEFTVTTYQMCILMLFNAAQELSYQQIAAEVGIPDKELKRHLISLAAPKFRILIKEPKGRVIAPDTRFVVNTGFKSKHYRVRVPLISTRENLGSVRAAVPEQVEEDRRHLIEAAIVRIMKARKSLEHNLLLAEVTKQMSSRFNPSPQQIKKRIESLIEREYLERSDADRKIYQYLA